MAPKTTGRRLTSLRAFARWAGLGPILDDYSAPTPAKSKPHPLPEGIEGLTRLVNAANNEQQRSLIALCGYEGCRVSEALEIGPQHFDLHHMLLTIRGKGDKTRIIPISNRAWDVLAIPVTRAFVAESPRIITFRDRFARRVITDMGVKAGLKRHISSHDLRATIATHMLNQGVNIRVVQEFLGHAQVTTTQLYTEADLNIMREAVDL